MLSKDQLGKEKIKGHFIALARSSPKMQESKEKESERYQWGTDYAVTTKEHEKKGETTGVKVHRSANPNPQPRIYRD